jgi:hypothetical protein
MPESGDLGARVCRYHGGAAKQVVRAARVRLQNAAEKMARELLGMATNPDVSDPVKLAAIKDALPACAAIVDRLIFAGQIIETGTTPPPPPTGCCPARQRRSTTEQ